MGATRLFVEVALPWLEENRSHQSITVNDADLICTVCHFPRLLSDDRFRDDFTGPFSKLIAENPVEVGELIHRVGVWLKKQAKTKDGRLRRVIEIAMTHYPYSEEPLGQPLLWRVAAENKINLKDVSPDYVRGRLVAIRKEQQTDDAHTEMQTLLKLRQSEGRWVQQQTRHAEYQRLLMKIAEAKEQARADFSVQKKLKK